MTKKVKNSPQHRTGGWADKRRLISNSCNGYHTPSKNNLKLSFHYIIQERNSNLCSSLYQITNYTIQRKTLYIIHFISRDPSARLLSACDWLGRRVGGVIEIGEGNDYKRQKQEA